MRMINCKPYSEQELYLQVANTQYLWVIVQCTDSSDWRTELIMSNVHFTDEQYKYLEKRLKGDIL